MLPFGHNLLSAEVSAVGVTDFGKKVSWDHSPRRMLCKILRRVNKEAEHLVVSFPLNLKRELPTLAGSFPNPGQHPES